MKTDRSSSAIALALAALRAEKKDLENEISASQTRVKDVQLAIASMETLIKDDASQSSIAVPDALPMMTEKVQNPIASLPFAKALERYMSTAKSPGTARQITEGLRASGFKFNSKNEMTQVYVGLKRKSGTLYERVDGGKKWALKSIFS